MTMKPSVETRRWTKQSLMFLVIILLVFYSIGVTIIALLIGDQLQKTENDLNNTSLNYELLRVHTVGK